MKRRRQRRPDWRKSPPKRMIRYIDYYAAHEEQMFHAWMNNFSTNSTPHGLEGIRKITGPSSVHIYTATLASIAVIASSPSRVETKPMSDGLFQHTFTWEVA